MTTTPTRTKRVLGCFLSDESCCALTERITREGGLVVVPSAPGLATIDTDPAYRNALIHADHVVVDSGYLALLSVLSGHGRLKRVSGLRLIDAMLNMPEMARPGASFWLMPSQVEAETTCEYLGERGIALREPHTATAPTYPETGTIEDATLLNQLEELKPKFVILNIAGGKQEKLGYYLRQNLSYKPAIICTGAAIAFLTGHQARIPMWADRLFLGWLWRCCEKPGIYIPRYLSAVRLAYLVFRYGEELPPLKTAN